MNKLNILFLALIVAVQLTSCRMVRTHSGSAVFTDTTKFDNENLEVNVYAKSFSNYPEMSGAEPPMPIQLAVALSKKALGQSRWSHIGMQLSEVALQHVSPTWVYSMVPLRKVSLNASFYVVQFKAISKEHTGLLPVIVLFDGNVLTPEISE